MVLDSCWAGSDCDLFLCKLEKSGRWVSVLTMSLLPGLEKLGTIGDPV